MLQLHFVEDNHFVERVQSPQNARANPKMEILKRIYGHSSLVFDEPFLFGRSNFALSTALGLL